MIEGIVAVLVVGAIAALGLRWGVRRDDQRRGLRDSTAEGAAGFPLWYGDSASSADSPASWSDSSCDAGDSGSGDCGGGGD